MRVLRLFNVGVSEFVRNGRDRALEVQNALARLGAKQLHESTSVLPSIELEEVHDVVREALLLGESRLVTAVAPVLVAQAARINVNLIYSDLESFGHERRVLWIIDNTLLALETLATETGGTERTAWSKLSRRVDVPLRASLEAIASHWELPAARPFDVLDPTIRTRRTLEEVQRRASKPSARWGIVTSLQVADFVKALEASSVAD